jgi:cob(I)alamin adenosyltransferase
MKIYTKTGDKGETSLFGGERVWKNNERIESYGTVDELNSVIGLAVSEIHDSEILNALKDIQNELFTLGADLATPFDAKNNNVPRVTDELVNKAEETIDLFNCKIPELRSFILPGGTKGAALLHFARTVCRRAERKVLTLRNHEDIGNKILVYLNRISDLLFVLARYENYVNGTPDTKWEK